MLFGAHLPIAGFDSSRPAASSLIECAEAAETLGYTTLCANDHLVFPIPWIDGLVALGVAAARTKSIGLMTTASLLVVRGPAPLGSAVAALAHLSGDRVTVCVTPGSTISDYDSVGIPFDERWSRFDAALPAFRSYLDRAGVRSPLWIASWGSQAGLRRVARYGEGWLASAYHSTPEHFAGCLTYLNKQLDLSERTTAPSPTQWRPCTPTSRTIRLRRTEFFAVWSARARRRPIYVSVLWLEQSRIALTSFGVWRLPGSSRFSSGQSPIRCAS